MNTYPLLAPEVDFTDLPGPLQGKHSIRLTDPAGLAQFIEEMSIVLSASTKSAAKIHSTLSQFANEVADKIENLHQHGSGRSAKYQSGANSTPNGPPNDVASIIHEHCASEWPDDFEMLDHCIEKQRLAVAELEKGRPTDIPEAVFDQVRHKAAKEWPNDFVMRAYTEEKQFAAYRRINIQNSRG